jgi:hypothetical protein
MFRLYTGTFCHVVPLLPVSVCLEQRLDFNNIFAVKKIKKWHKHNVELQKPIELTLILIHFYGHVANILNVY